MENIKILLSDIIEMKFDVVIPLSGCIFAILMALVMFSVRYYSFIHKRNKFKNAKRTPPPARKKETAQPAPVKTEEEQLEDILREAADGQYDVPPQEGLDESQRIMFL